MSTPRHSTHRRFGLACAVLGLGAFVLAGTDAPQSGANVAITAGAIEAVTKPVYDAQLGFPIVGRVARVLVKPGDHVHEGQELIKLEDGLPAAQLQVLELRAKSELEVLAAKGDWDIAKLQRELVAEAFHKQGANALELERAVLEEEKARLAYELFKQRGEEARRQAVEGRERLDQFTLRAPRDGEVDRLVAEPGEVVQEQRPVLRLVNIRTLRVDVAVPTHRTLGLRPGNSVWMCYPDTTNLLREARVVHLAPVADSASDTRTVRVEFENAEGSPAGRTALIWISKPVGSALPSH